MDAPAHDMTAAHVITVSDGAYHGTREDRSGAALVELLRGHAFEVGEPEVVPDERDIITHAIIDAADGGARLVITTGGTGLGPRDVTPQATREAIDYDVPGIGEAMRRAGAQSTPMAAISRGIAGVRRRTLVINLPGSPKGAVESLESVLPVLDHALALLAGDTEHKPF